MLCVWRYCFDWMRVLEMDIYIEVYQLTCHDVSEMWSSARCQVGEKCLELACDDDALDKIPKLKFT
jgi:hypothetical protein